MVPPTSHKVSRVSWYFGSCCCLPVSHTGLSPCLARFPKTVLLPSSSLVQSITPKDKSSGLGSSHFARHYFGNRCFFLFLRLLRCFSSPGSRLHPIRLPFFTCRRTGCSCAGSPIQIPTDYRVSAAPRGFSQLAASFFGPQRQGIRPAPFFA